jgi:hypothetical protein
VTRARGIISRQDHGPVRTPGIRPDVPEVRHATPRVRSCSHTAPGRA